MGNLRISSRFLISATLFFRWPKKRPKRDPKDCKIVIFFKKLLKLPSDLGLCPQTPVNNTLELHQLVQHAAQQQHFLSRIILTFGFKLLFKILVATVRIYLIW